MNIFFFHVFLATFLSYLLVSIVYRDLLWSITFVDLNRYRGKRAVLLATGILFLASFVMIPVLKDRYEWFNLKTLGFAFLVGLPLAWVFYKLLSRLANKHPLLNNVSQNLKPHSVTIKRFVFFSIVGILIGVVFGFVLFVVSNSLFLSVTLGLILAIIISWLLARANWM